MSIQDKFNGQSKALSPHVMRKTLTAIETTALVSELEARKGFRVLRELSPLPLHRCSPTDGLRCAIVVDTESTGLVMPGTVEPDAAPHSEIVSVAMVSVSYDPADGAVKGAIGRFHAFREPSHPIPATATAIHGITDDMVRGKKISEDEIAEFIALSAASVQANTLFGSRDIERLPLIIAHSARFDRTLLEHTFPSIFVGLPWACSQSQIPWSDWGFEGTKLFYLAFKAGFYYAGRHSALADADAALKLLRQSLGSRSAMSLLCEAARRRSHRLSLITRYDPATIAMLKERGYRWRAQSKTWSWQGVDGGLATELEFLDQAKFQASRDVTENDAFDRFSQRD